MSVGHRARQAHWGWSLLGRPRSTYGLTALALGFLLLSPSPTVAQVHPHTLALSPALSLPLSGEARAMPDCDPFQLRAGGVPLWCRDLQPGAWSPTLLSADDVPPSLLQSPEETRQPKTLLASLVTAGVLAGAAAYAFTPNPHRDFHFTSEGFFGRDTYAGGADKAGHFTDSAIAAKELAIAYDRLGFSPGTSRLLGFGVSALGGLLIEFGDGTTFYGFSFEDLTMDVLGAGTSTLVLAAGLDDLIGFRHGFLLPHSGSATCCKVPGKGHDYSNELLAADLKIAGLARRLALPVGPLRYLLFSLTYSTKSYPSGLPEIRERLIGFEIGLN